jgi:hypothetical protein
MSDFSIISWNVRGAKSAGNKVSSSTAQSMYAAEAGHYQSL